MCVECDGSGILTHAPDGETVHCEWCIKGLTLALRAMDAHLGPDRDLLARHQAEGHEAGWEALIFSCELEEYERLRGLLLEMQSEDEDSLPVYEDLE